MLSRFRVVSCLGLFAATAFANGTARAEAAPAATAKPDFTQPRESPNLNAGAPPLEYAHRNVAIEITPLSLIIEHYGAGLELMPFEHHALLLSAYYFATTTAKNPNPSGGPPNNITQSNDFNGVGGEIGYRYYYGHNGPRGLFVGPSLLLGEFKAVPSRGGSSTSFYDLGVGADVGYQAILGDAWVFGFSAGAQYTWASHSFLAQEAPAAYHANSGIHPRMQIAVGYAFDL
jgi:hypothetical protein